MVRSREDILLLLKIIRSNRGIITGYFIEMSFTKIHKEVTQIWQRQDTKSLIIFHDWNNSTSGSAPDFLKTYFISVRKDY